MDDWDVCVSLMGRDKSLSDALNRNNLFLPLVKQKAWAGERHRLWRLHEVAVDLTYLVCTHMIVVYIAWEIFPTLEIIKHIPVC